MGWLAIVDPGQDGGSKPDLRELEAAQMQAGGGDALLLCGTLVVEMSIPDSARPEPLLLFAQDGDWPLQLGLQSVPGGGINLVLAQSEALSHATLNATGQGRTGQLRLTYVWDCRAGRSLVTLEQVDTDRVQITEFQTARPWRYQDLRMLLAPGPLRVLSPSVSYLALSDQAEPVGLVPGFDPDTPVATPQGYRHIKDLQRGDLVISEEGNLLPVLHVLHREVPARGLFRPVRLRAPFFDLQQDIQVAASQRLVLRGSEVEYMFGKPAVLVPARHLLGTSVALPGKEVDRRASYTQVVLPEHAPLMVAGAALESLYLGSLRRDPMRLRASQLATAERGLLPEHGAPRYPALGAFDAAVLAERRVA